MSMGSGGNAGLGDHRVVLSPCVNYSLIGTIFGWEVGFDVLNFCHTPVAFTPPKNMFPEASTALGVANV